MSNRDPKNTTNTGAGGASGSTTGNTGSTAGNTGGGSGLAGTGATSAGTTRDSSASLTTAPTTGGGSSAGTGTATGMAAQAKEYGQKVADAATQAKEYVSDKASAVGTVVSDKFKDLQNVDYKQVAEDAREYARQKPGQALLISAAAGFLLGLLLRGSRR